MMHVMPLICIYIHVLMIDGSVFVAFVRFNKIKNVMPNIANMKVKYIIVVGYVCKAKD